MRPPLGQHFLKDSEVVQRIIASAELQVGERVLEIGPGKGVLTGELLGRIKDLTVVELDNDLADRLENRYKNHSGFRVIQQDFLKVDLDSLFPEGPVRILGNLPYSITSPIFEKLLAWPKWETGVFLIQKEVAERIQSAPGSRTFGILSLAVQLFASVETIVQVTPQAFLPPPKVFSTVIRLRRKQRPELAEKYIPAFFDLAHAAFSHRRKVLANSLALFADLPKEKTQGWLVQMGVEPTRRAETLALNDFVKMAEAWSIFRRETNLT